MVQQLDAELGMDYTYCLHKFPGSEKSSMGQFELCYDRIVLP
jgi:hypothetical protein